MMPVKMVPLQQVDLSDQTFSVNFFPDFDRLRASIRELGLVQPILLKEKTNGYRIVSGFRRISVARELGYGEIEARIFGEETEDLKLFFISLHENLTSRGFNVVEKAIALEKLTDHFKVDPAFIARELLSLFNLETNEKILNTFLSLARMEEEVQSYILREEVSRSNIRRLAAWSAEDRKAAMVLLNSLRLGENSLREMITLIEEIGKRDRCGIESIVALPEIQDTLSHPELTSTQKTERVKKILTGLRYPRMSQLETEFERNRRDLNLPPGVSLSHPPFFEGKGLRIGFQFQSLEEYRSVLSSLSSLGENEKFRAMINPTPPPSPRKGDGHTG